MSNQRVSNNDDTTAPAAVAYYRVSTQRQGESGLGLEAQRAAVERYATARNLQMIAEYTEIETGTSKRRRVEIFKAIDAARDAGAVLLIAKLDRLARDVAFISALMNSGVQFVAVDMPEANQLTVHILAAVAEHEAKMISDRTRAALQARRDRVGEWRVSNLDDQARAQSRRSRRAAAVAGYRGVAGYARLLRQNGKSYRAIAARLNQDGHRTRNGKRFHGETVRRMLDICDPEA